MNFRETLIRRVLELLAILVIDDSQTQSSDQGRLLLTSNPNYACALRKVLAEPLGAFPIDNPAEAPAAYVSFDGGRNDLGADTFLSHIVEVLSIRIDILLSKKIGVNDAGEPRQMTFQVSDALADINRLINLASMQSALHVLEEHITVQEVVLEEWGFDEQFRGGNEEVLSLVFQIEVANPRNQ